MKKRKQKLNPHCPVPGCKAAKPHAVDTVVKSLIHEFAPPEKMTSWVLAAMAELRNSIDKDLKNGQLFAFLTRLRQPEELYIRTLYALFIATDKELPHILSGDMPNGLSEIYKKVNEVVFEGRGLLLLEQPGLQADTFAPIDILNDGAHVSFPAFLTCMGLIKNPEYLAADFVERYFKHLTTYCNYLQYMHGMFNAGKSKAEVLAGVRNLHKPASYWKAQQEQVKAKLASEGESKKANA